MSTTLIVILIVVVVLVIAVGVVFFFRRRRSQRLSSDFGAEYDREVAGASSRSAAENDLQQRKKRHSRFDIRVLNDAERDGYRRSWDQLQAQFVDSPANAVRDADTLVTSIMAARGYPTDDFDQRAEDLSVEHPEVVQHYRDEGAPVAVSGGWARAATDRAVTGPMLTAYAHSSQRAHQKGPPRTRAACATTV